jgi:hypothetical protein
MAQDAVQQLNGSWASGSGEKLNSAFERIATPAGQLFLDFYWDPLSINIQGSLDDDCPIFARYDAVYVGVPAFWYGHLSGYLRQFPTVEEYQGHLDQLFRRLQSCRALHPTATLILASGPAMPPRDDAAQAEACRRTNGRMDVWARMARAMAEALDVSFVDLFNATQPFVWDSPDMLHYRGTDAYTHLTQEVLHRLDVLE